MLANGLTFLTALLPLLSVADAAHSAPRHHRRHHGLAARDEPHPRGIAQVAPRANAGHSEAKRTIKRAVKKRGAQQQCRVRGSAPPTAASSAAASAVSSVAADSAVPSPAAPSSAAAAQTPSIPNQNAWADQSAQSSAAAAPSAAAPSPSAWSAPAPAPSQSSGGGLVGGIISISDGTCGNSNASPDAPNGAEEWLNCGLTSGGWSPPHLGLGDLVTESLHADGVFAPCAPYFWAFEQHGAANGIPPILLASFSMQESTCNPSATGGNGEAGLMQLASMNCAGAPGGNCYDIDFNVGAAARLFKGYVDAAGGNVLVASGQYNGWRVGMTADDAQAAKWQGNCHAQNNLDYLHQLFNGWCQGKAAYTMGTWFNLAGC